MYVILGFRFIGGSSQGGSVSSADGVADDGLTRGRPTNGPFEEVIESGRRCATLCPGIMGMLLLVGSEGRLPWACTGTMASVSVRFKAVNLDGGGGLEPEGRDSLLLRRSSRYWAG